MNKECLNKFILEAEKLDNEYYSYSAGVRFKLDIEKYCKIVKSENCDCLLVFNLKKIRKDAIHYVPHNIENLEFDCGRSGHRLFKILEDTRSYGVDGFIELLQYLIDNKLKYNQ
jgi:hypothetical protein